MVIYNTKTLSIIPASALLASGGYAFFFSVSSQWCSLGYVLFLSLARSLVVSLPVIHCGEFYPELVPCAPTFLLAFTCPLSLLLFCSLNLCVALSLALSLGGVVS